MQRELTFRQRLLIGLLCVVFGLYFGTPVGGWFILIALTAVATKKVVWNAVMGGIGLAGAVTMMLTTDYVFPGIPQWMIEVGEQFGQFGDWGWDTFGPSVVFAALALSVPLAAIFVKMRQRRVRRQQRRAARRRQG